ncbi:MAG: cell wall hydrolase [Pseudomonadota bacterium]
MFIRPTLWAAALFAIGGVSAASAEVVVSTSNNPQVVLGDTLRGMFDAEQAGLSAVSASRVKRLSVEPKPRGSGRGELLYDASFLRSMPFEKGGEAWACLTEALYFEARGESVRGIFAVGEVILNRVSHPDYPSDICGVIYQGTGKKYQCQFTYSCDGRKEVFSEPKAYENVGKIAAVLLEGDAPLNLTDGATHYHTKAVKPRWSRKFAKTTTIGVHHFYRKDDVLASR